jgi:hypothetical protein
MTRSLASSFCNKGNGLWVLKSGSCDMLSPQRMRLVLQALLLDSDSIRFVHILSVLGNLRTRLA